MRPKQALELKIPDLAGGLNLRDGLSEVLDNQLTDCKNMWWNDGLLKTRPGTKATEKTVTYINRPSRQIIGIKNFPDIKYTKEDKTYYLQTIKRILPNYSGEYYTIIKFLWQSKDESLPLGDSGISVDGDNVNYFVCCKRNLLYCFTSDFKIHKLNLTSTVSMWEEVKEEDYYIPIVYAHCTAVNFSGTQIESTNLLGNKFKMIYSTINLNLSPVTSDDGSGNVSTVYLHEMYYPFPDNMITNPDEYIGKEIKAVITNESGAKTTHSAVFTKVSNYNNQNVAEGWETSAGADGLVMHARTDGIWFHWNNGTGDPDTMDPAQISPDAIYVEDNLEVIVPYVPTIEDKNKIFNMTQSTWFGGTVNGLAGGTRLFLCGNQDDEKSLVCWSGLDNPLYFPENSYFYVGDTTSAVKGFGKQSDKLIIFKEKETWYTYYQQNTQIEASDLINQTIIDYASSSVYFPLCQINSNIGCNYPDTIQLCRNRLVWLGDSGNVYTLVSESQYNERSIFSVSEMVKNKLKKENLLSAVACDWNGYYCLLVGKKLYLMDYNCYGYTHVSSYSKTEDANVRIPWYYWELPQDGVICSLDDKISLSYYHDGVTANQCAIVNNILSEDNAPIDSICYEDEFTGNLLFKDSPIESKITTKLFDFGQPSVRKNIDKISLQLGNNGGDLIKVEIITDCGAEMHEISLSGSQTQSYTPEYIESKAIFPCIKQVCRMGVRLSSTGIIAIDGMNLKYKTTGGAR